MRNGWRIFAGACDAWEMLTDLPLPKVFKRGTGPVANGSELLIWFPLLGALIGTVLAGFGGLAAAMTNRVAGAMCFALFSLAFMWFKDSGRGWLLLVSFLLNRRVCGDWSEALTAVSPNRGILTESHGAMLIFVLAATEFVILLLMGLFGAKLFVVAVLTGAFAVQGALAAHADADGESLINDGGCMGVRRMWYIAAVVAVCCFLNFPLATAFAIGVVYVTVMHFGGFIIRSCGKLEDDKITLAGAVAEVVLLFAGFFWALDL